MGDDVTYDAFAAAVASQVFVIDLNGIRDWNRTAIHPELRADGGVATLIPRPGDHVRVEDEDGHRWGAVVECVDAVSGLTWVRVNWDQGEPRVRVELSHV